MSRDKALQSQETLRNELSFSPLRAPKQTENFQKNLTEAYKTVTKNAFKISWIPTGILNNAEDTNNPHNLIIKSKLFLDNENFTDLLLKELCKIYDINLLDQLKKFSTSEISEAQKNSSLVYDYEVLSACLNNNFSPKSTARKVEFIEKEYDLKVPYFEDSPDKYFKFDLENSEGSAQHFDVSFAGSVTMTSKNKLKQQKTLVFQQLKPKDHLSQNKLKEHFQKAKNLTTKTLKKHQIILGQNSKNLKYFRGQIVQHNLNARVEVQDLDNFSQKNLVCYIEDLRFLEKDSEILNFEKYPILQFRVAVSENLTDASSESEAVIEKLQQAERIVIFKQAVYFLYKNFIYDLAVELNQKRWQSSQILNLNCPIKSEFLSLVNTKHKKLVKSYDTVPSFDIEPTEKTVEDFLTRNKKSGSEKFIFEKFVDSDATDLKIEQGQIDGLIMNLERTEGNRYVTAEVLDVAGLGWFVVFFAIFFLSFWSILVKFLFFC